MQIIILANQSLKDELLSKGVQPEAELIWVGAPADFLNYPTAFACIDLLFDNSPERLRILEQISVPVIINSVAYTLKETNPAFVRINGWNSFLQSEIVEAAATTEEARQRAEAVLAQFNKKVEWLADEPGFVTPRVISMIINEAFFALAEGVSSPTEIDTAMKLGTNYPYGPFEWADKIGVENLALLLEKLSIGERRYEPASLLMQKKK